MIKKQSGYKTTNIIINDDSGFQNSSQRSMMVIRRQSNFTPMQQFIDNKNLKDHQIKMAKNFNEELTQQIINEPMNFMGDFGIKSSEVSSSDTSSYSDGDLNQNGNGHLIAESPTKMSQISKNSKTGDALLKYVNPAIRRLQFNPKENMSLMNSTESNMLSRSVCMARGQEVEQVQTVQVENYKILKKIGSGSFADVYKGRHLISNKIYVRNFNLK